MEENTLIIPPVAEDPVSPLEFLETVYSCNDLPLPVRMKAAIAAAQYKHPKLAVQANLNADLGALMDRLAKAREAKAITDQLRAEGRLKELERKVPPMIEGEAVAGLPASQPGFKRRV